MTISLMKSWQKKYDNEWYNFNDENVDTDIFEYWIKTMESFKTIVSQYKMLYKMKECQIGAELMRDRIVMTDNLIFDAKLYLNEVFDNPEDTIVDTFKELRRRARFIIKDTVCITRSYVIDVHVK